MERSTLLTSTSGADVEHGRGEVQDAGDAGLDHLVGDVLGGGGRRRDHADGDALLAHDRVEVAERAYVDARRRPRCGARRRRRGGRRRGSRGCGSRSSWRARGPRLPMPTITTGQSLRHPHLAGDLVAQVVHVVPDAAGAVAAEVGQVLAELGAVDARGRGEVLARARRGAGLGQRGECPQVDGQSRHGRLGNLPGGVVGRPCAQGSVSPAAEHGVDPWWDRPGPSGVVHCKSL